MLSSHHINIPCSCSFKPISTSFTHLCFDPSHTFPKRITHIHTHIHSVCPSLATNVNERRMDHGIGWLDGYLAD